MIITPRLLSIGQRRSGYKLVSGDPKFIVIHDTGNPNSTAIGNAKWYQESYNGVFNKEGKRVLDCEQSAHLFIDDKEAIQVIPFDEKAWHVMYDKPADNQIFGDDANDIALGVEICYGDQLDMQKVYWNAVACVGDLCFLYHLHTHNLTTHFILDPMRKTDPLNALAACGKTWMKFLDDVYMYKYQIRKA